MLLAVPRRGVAAAVALALLCLTLALATAAPARAAKGKAGLPNQQSVPGAEWWFSSWDIQTKVWPLTRGAGVTVGVVDSGVEAELPDLRGAVVPGGNTIGIDNNGFGDGEAPTGHGTGIAALIAGQGVNGSVFGIAPAAKILPVLVLVGEGVGTFDEASSWGTGTQQEVAAGIRLAVKDGVQVINLSLAANAPSASSCNPVLQDAVAYALQHNVVVVASAGNFVTLGNPPEEPASCAGVLGVGAVGPNLQVWAHSERQPYVAVSAPGVDVPFLTAVNTILYDDGTSEASAFVAGEAALIRSRYPSMPWYGVVQRIINTALPEGSRVPNDRYGYGIVRIDRAVNASEFAVSASAPNPVYAAFKQWLASPAGEQFTSPSPSPTRPHPARTSPVTAKASSGGSGIGVLAAVIAVVIVLAAGTALFVVARRRRRPA
jgi:hypothetical protein